jgi:anti-sigma B factor antagonist
MSQPVPKRLELTVENLGHCAVLKVHGSAGIGDVESLRRCLQQVLDAQTPAIVLDLSEMDFICSAGLGAIIDAHLRSRHYKGQIRLLKPQSRVMELLEMTRLTKLFPVFTDRALAVA